MNHCTITCNRDCFGWTIKPQEECPELGVDIQYLEMGKSKGKAICLGDLDDAEELAKAILLYVKTTRELRNDQD